ncbi:hypothetical protein BU25DRAFT_328197 [Macroventuria anomochaeta]|uniref:Uncharacterized protein n=1 Tax=Macroventuria anomochaeta TaxID=301207 RepID=A0ACB6SIM2_9PLEO|nr:uncharacterized protein BU25DRAFT_328197 [Macroventuria anomochaeta]KAF2633868.1 hypothetical protein BU25DRAFT_328197 [Macroventuria anomochaeta]
MQRWWDKAFQQQWSLLEGSGYSNVAVLLLKWADELDELKTRDEVEELEALFRERFHFHTEIVELDLASKPQLQMNRCLSTFIEKHDGPHRLHIVYYSGHSRFDEFYDRLDLAASINPDLGKLPYKDAVVNWRKAEDLLRSDEIDADVLAILDTPYSNSSTEREGSRENSRRFEVLGACPIDQTTAAPGKNSFTRALIDELRDLLREYGDKPFNSFHLNQRICMNALRRDTPSQLWHLLRSEQNILISPMVTKEKAKRKSHLIRAPRGRLTLTFDLRDEEMNHEQIQVMARGLAKVLEYKKMIGLRKINWHGIQPTAMVQFEKIALAMLAIVHWRKIIQRRRHEAALKVLSK